MKKKSEGESRIRIPKNRKFPPGNDVSDGPESASQPPLAADAGATVGETLSINEQPGGLAYALALLGLLDKQEGSNMASEFWLIEVIRGGIGKSSLDKLMITMEVTAVEMARILRVSDRTLRRYATTDLLDAVQSERLVDLALLYSRGVEVFGSMQLFRRWTRHRVFALGNRCPIDLLDTSVGIQMIYDTLGRMEHGITA